MEILVLAEQHNDERVIKDIGSELEKFNPDVIYHELCIVYDTSMLEGRKCVYIEPDDLKKINQLVYEYENTGMGWPTIGYPSDISDYCIENKTTLASIDVPNNDREKLKLAGKAQEHQAREMYMTSVLLDELDELDVDRVAIVVGAAHLRSVDSKISGGHSTLRMYLDSRNDVTYGNPFVIKAADKEAIKLNKEIK